MGNARGILTAHLRAVIGTAGAALAAGVLIAAGPATAAAPLAHAAATRVGTHHKRHHRKHHRRHHKRHQARAASSNATQARSASVDNTPKPLIPLPPCLNADTPATSASAADMRLAVECLVNQERTNHGLPALADNAQLANSAQSWADHMVATGDFTHGNDFAGRITAVGYDWQEAGENIATGYETPSDVVQAWMQSPEHCQNILDPDYVSFGTGVNTAPVGTFATDPSTWSQDFGLTMSQTAPSQNQGPMNGCPYAN